MSPWTRTPAAIASLCSLIAILGSAPGPATAEEFIPLAEWVGADGLDGDAIYERLLDNRFTSYDQALQMRSKDRGGHSQQVDIDLKYLRTPDDPDVASHTLAKYLRPSDVRHLGYLVINKRSGPDDQFVYRPSSRRVRRINVRSEAIAGTDFAMEDVIPQELEDGRHLRQPDTDLGERPVYVVVVVPNAETESDYSKFILYIEKQHYVPLLTEYWDLNGVKIKQLKADPKSIQLYEAEGVDGRTKRVWIAQRSRMNHLQLESRTVLEILQLTPNPGLRARDFSQRKLTASH